MSSSEKYLEVVCLFVGFFGFLFGFFSSSLNGLEIFFGSCYCLIQYYCRRMNHRRMLKNCSRVNHTTGETGQSLGEGTACISGVMLQPWSYLMVVMDGSDLSWMESWPQCIPVGALKEDLTAQVDFL